MTKYVIKYQTQEGIWIVHPHLYDTMAEAEMAAALRKELTKVDPIQTLGSSRIP